MKCRGDPKLTRDDVVLIRALVKERIKLDTQKKQLTNKIIGRKFGVSAKCISDIANYDTWKSV